MPNHSDAKQELASLKKILSNLPGHIYWVDTNGIVLGCNEVQATSMGLSVKDIIGKNIKDLYSDDIAQLILHNNNLVIKSNKPMLFEEPSVREDGLEMTVLSHKTPLYNDDKQIIGVLGLSLDITDYKSIELSQLDFFARINREVTGESLQEHSSISSYLDNIRGYLENIISLMPGNIYWKSKNGTILGCNDNMAKYFGYQNRYDLIGRTDYDILDKEQADIIKNTDKGIMLSGKPKTLEEISKLAGKKTTIFLTRKQPLYDINNNVIGLLGVSIDVTQNKKIEEKLRSSKNKEKVLKEKLQAMDAVAASIAHELRTPLSAIIKGTEVGKFLERLIIGYNMAAEAGLPVPFIRQNLIEGTKEALNNIKKEARSANQIITMLLTNLQSLEDVDSNFKTYSISECITKSLKRYPFDSEKEHMLVNYKPGSDFSFTGEPILLDHIIFNLLKNALYYVTKSQKGTINIWLDANDKCNIIHFKDTSTGIAPDLLPKIFDRFVSNTPNGTGMGLAFCKMAMEKMGGYITCTSKLGEFTEFTLYFPKK
ncbi:MAG: PAS domain-containing sensor histidine kinase [Gammaproteobacteria bacterium]|nr:PAS domain-containing sensor histidine kinase [Gammaproteobacteria bacterium]